MAGEGFDVSSRECGALGREKEEVVRGQVQARKPVSDSLADDQHLTSGLRIGQEDLPKLEVGCAQQKVARWSALIMVGEEFQREAILGCCGGICEEAVGPLLTNQTTVPPRIRTGDCSATRLFDRMESLVQNIEGKVTFKGKLSKE